MKVTQMQFRRSRSSLVVAVLGIGVLAGCSTTTGPTASATAPATIGADATAVKGEPTLGPDLAAVRQATAKFHDVDVAIAAGYLNPAGRTCDQIAIGAMGIHSPNLALQGTQTLDPLQPEVLLYLPKPEGGFKLIGVEYIQFVLLRNPATGAVAPWTSQTPWPANYQIVTPTPSLFGQTFQGPMPGHVPGMPWHWDLHAWIWANNPSGVFEPWNPAVSCQ